LSLAGGILRKSSVSPTRSMLGGVSTYIGTNKERVEQAIQERCTKAMEELHKVKKE